MRNDYIVKKLYVSFIVVSILSALTATAGMLIDNIIVGMFLGDDALGAMGIIGPISLVFSAFGNICSGGGTARASQALGKGNAEKMHQIFSVTMLFVLLSGAILTIAGMIFAPQIAKVLGAQGELLTPSVDYLRGYFLGAIPTIMTTALMGFVKIDGSPRLPLLCIGVMTIANIILDVAMVTVFDLGMLGMALATSISYCLAVLTALTHFRKKSATLRLAKPEKIGEELVSMVTTGAPTAISRICDTIKVMVLNNLLVAVVGVGAVTALNIRTQANNFFGVFIFGLAQASIPLIGMFFGEEDRSALKDTLKNAFKIGLFINVTVAVVLFLIAPLFVGMMNVTDPVIKGMSVTAVRLFAVTMPFALFNSVMMSYYQSTKNTGIATMICILQSLVYTVLFAVILVHPMKQTGVWIAFLCAEIFTIITTLVIITIGNKKIPRNLEDLMRLKESFGGNPKDKLELSIGNSMDEVMKISQGIYKFGKSRKIETRLLNQLSLCIEEMGGNVIQHAFAPGEKKWFDVMILDKKDSLVVRLRDNGKMFDPTKFAAENADKKDTYGIRIIQGIAESVQYRRALEVNNLIITLKK